MSQNSFSMSTAAPSGYAKLGPGADVTLGGPDASKATFGAGRRLSSGAAVVGFLAALVAANLTNAVRASHLTSSSPASPVPSSQNLKSAKDISQLNRMRPQQQAESLLELAVGESDGALDQISARINGWRGQIAWTPRIASLTTAALNSNDLQVRGAGIEVELAAYGLRKDSATLDLLLREANSPAHAQKIWALWTLGLLANRGVETERVVQNLSSHLQDADVDSRRWTVEALALVGTDSTISPLLHAMHDDPAASVRERAACSLAQSGMLTQQQRMHAVPQLVSYSDDPSLDAQTHAWAFQALGDITHQRLPNDSGAWRNWYASLNGE